MPSHSPYALYSLTINLVLELFKNQRFFLLFWNWSLPWAFLLWKNLCFHNSLIIFRLSGFDILSNVFLVFSLSSFTLFSFQGTIFWILLWSLPAILLADSVRVHLRILLCRTGSCSLLSAPQIITVVAFLFGVLSRFALQNAGGDEENRTPDPLLARQVLSQLSYTPVFLYTLALA